MIIDTKWVETTVAERGLTQSELAAQSGLSRQSLSTILRRGTAAPRTVGKLAKGLGVPVAEIIKEA